MSDLKTLIASIDLDCVSDIFISADTAPYIRKGGKVLPIEHAAIVHEDEIADFRREVLDAALENKYQLNGAFDIGCTINEQRFRVNFYAALNGSALALRPIKDGGSMDILLLNLPVQLIKLAEESRGLLLVSGSTGCGKSTTLAAIINYINIHFNKHILSLEDPIEFIHKNKKSLISQREINIDSLSFAEAIKNAMRENPDVIVIGEMRDPETMQAAVNAALTGHLVISTVHTADTIQAIERIINLFPEEQRLQLSVDLSSSLLGIVAQRLIVGQDEKTMLPAVEIMLGTPTIKKLIADRNFQELESALKEGSNSGMISFSRAIFKLFLDGRISLAKALEFAGNKDEMMLLVKGMENGVDAFRNHYGKRADDAADEDELIDIATLLRSAVKMGSSDLLLSVNAPPSVRLDGMIRNMDLPLLQPMDVQRLLFSIITPHQRVLFEENRELDFALSVNLNLSNVKGEEKNFRFRINAFFQRGNIGIVARVINSIIPNPETLMLPAVLCELTRKKQGLILITGPTGSGKTTTLASLIDLINRNSSLHIITIEDPIEYVHENINSIIEQRELNSDTRDFATALKYTLRQDPDVILVGEMRDIATMSAAITAAETGHLVFATIHTNNAPQTIDRIVDSFPDHQQNQIKLQLAGVILGIVSQRLLSRIDGNGRVAAFEVMTGTPPIQALIRDGKTHQLQSAIETGFKDGMTTLDKSLERLYNQGLITYEESQSFHLSAKSVKDF